MKILLLVATLLIFGIDSAAAQTVIWKEKIIGSWNYEGTEEFGVITPPDSTQQNDLVEFDSDGSYRIIEKNRESKGTYQLDETTRTVTLKAGGKSRLFYLKKSDPGILIIESQTPDLVRTRHRYAAVK